MEVLRQFAGGKAISEGAAELCCRLEPLRFVFVAGLEQELVEAAHFGMGHQVSGDFGECGGIQSRQQAVDDLAEGVKVACGGVSGGRGGLEQFGRQEARRAGETVGFPAVGHEAHVAEFGMTVHKDDIGGFDVAVHQPHIVHCLQTFQHSLRDVIDF